MPPADASRRRCAIYTRKSSEEGLEQEFNSLAAQREACEAYIRSQQHEGWVLSRPQPGRYRFDGISRPSRFRFGKPWRSLPQCSVAGPHLRSPSDAELCSQSTISRLENLPDMRALLRLGRALIEQYCASFRQVPKRIVLDVDDTFDRVHGGQQLRLFNAFHDDYGFQPIVVFDGEGRFVTALLRPGKRPGGHEIRAFLRRLVGALRAHWPRVEILLRADSHYACPEVFDWCRNNRVDWVLGLAPNAALKRHVEALEKTTAERFTTAPARGKVRRFAQFHDAARSWRRVERIIARAEAGAEGADTRFIVTNLEGGRAKQLYQRLYS